MLLWALNLGFAGSSTATGSGSGSTGSGSSTTTTTSGTISSTVFRTRKILDHAFRRCKVPAQKITGEMLDVANDLLYLLISEMANTNVPLWCIEKVIIPMYEGAHDVQCPIGTVDVLNVNLRDITRISGTYTSSSGSVENAFDGEISTVWSQTASGGYIQVTFDTPSAPYVFGILPAATGVWNGTIQVSSDGLTWAEVASLDDQAVTFGEWLWMDVEGIDEINYCRLQASSDTLLEISEFIVGNRPTEIPLSRINRDTYVSMPDKTVKGRPNMFWLDRRVGQPVMTLWPAPDYESTFRQLVVWRHRHIMDVGSMYEELDVPQRWREAVIWKLAQKIASEHLEVSSDIETKCALMAEQAMTVAWAEERDSAPMSWAPSIVYYTR